MITVKSPFRVSLEEEMCRNPEITSDHIKLLHEWIHEQPHLPKMWDEQLCQFIHACYFNMEDAKSTIQYYFKYNSSMPEFFSGWDPTAPELHTYVDNVLYAAILPKHDPNEQQIIVLRLNDTTPEKYDFATSVKWLLMSASRIQMEYGTQPGFILVYDGMGYSFSHLLKNPLSSVKNYIQYGKNASSIRITEIHFINSSSVTKKLISLIKPLLDKEMMKMVSFHTSSDGFFKNIPAARIPEDYGGSAQSLAELHKDNMKRMENLRLEIMGQEELWGKDNKKSEKSKTSVENAEASFRNLEID